MELCHRKISRACKKHRSLWDVFWCGNFPAGRGFGQGRVQEVQGKETKKGTKQSYEKVPKGYAVAPKRYDSCEALEHLVSSISQKKAEQEHIKFVYVWEIVRLAQNEDMQRHLNAEFCLPFDSSCCARLHWGAPVDFFYEAVCCGVRKAAKRSFTVPKCSGCLPASPKVYQWYLNLSKIEVRRGARIYWYSFLILNNNTSTRSFLVVPLWNVYFAQLWNEFPWVIS